MEIDHQVEDNPSSNEESSGSLNGVEMGVPPDMGMSISLNNNIYQLNITPSLQSKSEHEEDPSEEDKTYSVHKFTPLHHSM